MGDAGMTYLFVIPNLIGDLVKYQNVLSTEGYVLQHLNVHEIPASAGMTKREARRSNNFNQLNKGEPMQITNLKPKTTTNPFPTSKDHEYATKADLLILKSEIEKLEMRLIIKLGGMMAFWASAILTLIKL